MSMNNQGRPTSIDPNRRQITARRAIIRPKSCPPSPAIAAWTMKKS